jgi:hypothetical protein
LHHCIQPCARLPGSLACACPASLRALARQPCTRLPGSLAHASFQISPNRFRLAIWQYGLAQQPCPVAFAWQPFLAAFSGSLVCQPCQAALPASLAEKFASCFTAVGRPCSIAYFNSAGSLVQAFPAIKDIAILSLVYELISTCERR